MPLLGWDFEADDGDLQIGTCDLVIEENRELRQCFRMVPPPF